MVKNKLSSVLGVFFLLTLLILNMNMASAWDFDNVKSYDPITREVTITNAFGLGKDLATLQLTTPLNVFVAAGEDRLVGEFLFKTSDDVLGAFTDIYLTDLKNGKAISRGQQFKYKKYKEIKVDDYKTVCEKRTLINGTIIEECIRKEIGSHLETQIEWITILNPNNEFLAGQTYEIGIFVDVEVGDYGDWIPKVYGIEVKEWATWTADLNVDLFAGYKLDEGSGTIIDVYNTNNGTNTGLTNVSGKIGSAYQWGQDQDDVITLTTMSGLGGTIQDGMAISFWTQTNSTAASTDWMTPYVVLGGGDNNNFMMGRNNADDLHVYWDTASGGVLEGHHLNAGYNDGAWHHIVFVVDPSNNFLAFYVDGSQKATSYDSQASPVSAEYSVNALIGKDTSTKDYDGIIDEFYLWNRTISQSEVTQLYNAGAGITWTDNFGEDPIIILNSPSSANYTTTQNPQINFTASDDVELSDVKLYVNSILNQTNASGINNTDYLFDLALGDGDYSIYGKATDNESRTTNSATIRIVIDSIAPSITAATNLTDLVTLSLPINSTWTFNASDTHLDKCYYNTTNHNTTVITCNSTIQTEWTTQGNKTVTSCANDTFGFETCQTNYLYVYYIEETQAEDLDPVGEGTEVTFNFTVNMINIPSTTAYLVLNNTNYAATTSIAGTNGYYFERAVVIPDGWGDPSGEVIDWNWVYNISGVLTDEATDTTNITVYSLSIDDCSSYGERILNISLRDEEQNTLMFSPTVNDTKIEIDLEITAKDNSSLSWDYSTTWDADADGVVGVCIPSGILNNSEYRFDFTMGFKAEDYVQEFHYLDNGTLDSNKQYTSLTNDQIELFDLLLVDSTTFIFKFFDEDGLEVSDGLVHVFRKYIGDGEFREVERAKQDNNGETHLHLVEEDVIYYFKVSLNGNVIYTSSTYNAKCLSTPCQIELEASGEFQEFDDNWDLANGSYSITDDPSTRQVILTYSLDDPEYMNLTIFKYTNDPNTMEVVGTDQAYSTGGTLTVTIPQVAGNVSFIAAVYQGGEIIDTEWVNFNSSGRAYFGATGIFMALLLIICLVLMASSEGEGTLIFAIIGLILISSLKLIDLDYYALVGFICAAVILVWKIAERRKR